MHTHKQCPLRTLDPSQISNLLCQYCSFTNLQFCSPGEQSTPQVSLTCGVDCGWELRGGLEAQSTINNKLNNQTSILVTTTSSCHLSSINTTGWHRRQRQWLQEHCLSYHYHRPNNDKSVWDTDYDAPRALVFFTHWQLINREEFFSYYSIVTLIQ